MRKFSILQKILAGFIALQAIAAGVFVASFYISIWPLELLVSFTIQVALALTASVALSTILVFTSKVLLRHRGVMATLGVGLGISIFALFFSFNTQKPLDIDTSGNKSLTFATFNKLYSNTNDEAITAYFQKHDVDVIALQETQPAEVERIAKSLGFEHTYTSRTQMTARNTVLAVLSRYPFESAKVLELKTGNQVVRAVIEEPSGKKIAIYSVHLPGPFSSTWYEMRNQAFDSLADVVNNDALPKVIGGDFNTTVFSPALRTFTTSTENTITPVATGKLPACSWYGFGSMACIRIDHIFISIDMKLQDSTVAPDLGSDHRALTVKLTF